MKPQPPTLNYDDTPPVAREYVSRVDKYGAAVLAIVIASLVYGMGGITLTEAVVVALVGVGLSLIQRMVHRA